MRDHQPERPKTEERRRDSSDPEGQLGCLIVARKTREGIKIGDSIEIRIGKFKGERVQIMVIAPKSVEIVRIDASGIAEEFKRKESEEDAG